MCSILLSSTEKHFVFLKKLHISRRRAALAVWVGSCIAAVALCALVTNNLRRAWSLMDTPEAIYTTSIETRHYKNELK